MRKEPGDGRGRPWWHRLSNNFQALSFNKWVIGWLHRAVPSSQPSPPLPSLAFTCCLIAAPKAHSQRWHPYPNPTDKQMIREGICLIWHTWSPSTERGELPWGTESGSRPLRQCRWQRPAAMWPSLLQLSTIWKSETLLDSTGSCITLKTWVKRSLWQECSLKLWQPTQVPVDPTYQELIFATGEHLGSLMHRGEEGRCQVWLDLGVCNTLPGLQRWIWAVCPSEKLLGVNFRLTGAFIPETVTSLIGVVLPVQEAVGRGIPGLQLPELQQDKAKP